MAGTIANVVDYLRDSGTGENKLKVIQKIVDECGDAGPLEFVSQLIACGSPISTPTIDKVKVYLGMIEPEESADGNSDLEAIKEDPFNPDLIDNTASLKKAKKKKAKKKKAKKKKG